MKILKSSVKWTGFILVISCLMGFLGHRNQQAILRTEVADGVTLNRFATPLRQRLLRTANLNVLSTYDEIRNFYGLRIHVATASLLAPQATLACQFHRYRASRAVTWKARDDANIEIVARYLMHHPLPVPLVLHSVVAETRMNRDGTKKFLHRQLQHSYRGLEHAGLVVRSGGALQLAAPYRQQPDMIEDFDKWKRFNDRFVATRDMGDEIVFRLSPDLAMITFHPSPVNRFHAVRDTLTFNTPHLVKTLMQVQIDPNDALEPHRPVGLTLPVVHFLQSHSQPCRHL